MSVSSSDAVHRLYKNSFSQGSVTTDLECGEIFAECVSKTSLTSNLSKFETSVQRTAET